MFDLKLKEYSGSECSKVIDQRCQERKANVGQIQITHNYEFLTIGGISANIIYCIMFLQYLQRAICPLSLMTT